MREFLQKRPRSLTDGEADVTEDERDLPQVSVRGGGVGDGTPNKKQVRLGAFFGGAFAKKDEEGQVAVEAEAAIAVAEVKVEERIRQGKVEDAYQKECVQLEHVYVKNGSRDRFGAQRGNVGGRPRKDRTDDRNRYGNKRAPAAESRRCEPDAAERLAMARLIDDKLASCTYVDESGQLKKLDAFTRTELKEFWLGIQRIWPKIKLARLQKIH